MGDFRVTNTDQTTVTEIENNGLLFRTYDGSGNNLAIPDYGKAGKCLLRKSPVDYDGSQTTGVSVRGSSNPSPRLVSNEICQASLYGGSPESGLGLSDMTWMWGQFLDHEIDITPEQESGGETMDISTDDGGANEPFPGRTISFKRSKFAVKQNVRQQPNEISSFIDATNVYGNSSDRAYALRSLDGSGKLKTLLSDNGETILIYNTDSLPNAPSSDPSFFLAGDVRANENVGLMGLHVLFAREHNRLCDYLAGVAPQEAGKDELLYQHARRIISGIMQKITYCEFLPALLGSFGTAPYSESVDAGIATEFSTAGYRLGHTMVSENLQVGNSPVNTISLATAFFNPAYVQANGVDDVLLGATKKKMQEIDNIVVETLRSSLFGSPTATNLLDLAALNIQRGRDHGLPGYNALRSAYGLSTFSTFSSLPMPVAVKNRLQTLYDSPNDIDPWVGIISENHAAGMAVGPLAAEILRRQFSRLNTGDRFWFENDQSLTALDRQIIAASTLSRVLARNTPHTYLPDVFHV